MNSERTDPELIASLRDDPEALACFYRRHVGAVERFATRRAAQLADVADLVAVTFLAAIDSSRSFDPAYPSARSWLLGIANHLVARERSQQWRRHESTQRAAQQRVLTTNDLERLEGAIDAAREAPVVELALAGLPAKHRDVLWLIAHDNLDRREAAVVLGVSQATFRMRLHRARRALEAAMSDRRPAAVPSPAVSHPPALPTSELT